MQRLNDGAQKVQVELTARQLVALANLLQSERDWGEDGLTPALEALLSELKAKGRALGLRVREGYLYL